MPISHKDEEWERKGGNIGKRRLKKGRGKRSADNGEPPYQSQPGPKECVDLEGKKLRKDSQKNDDTNEKNTGGR